MLLMCTGMVCAQRDVTVSAEGTEQLHFVDVNGNTVFQEMEGAVDWLYHIAGTDDVLAVASTMNYLFQFNSDTGFQDYKLPVCDHPNAAVQARKSNTVWVACGMDHEVRAYYLPNFDLATPVGLAGEPLSLTLSTRHNKLVTHLAGQNKLAVIDLTQESLSFYLAMPGVIGSVFYGHDEEYLWVTLPELNQVRQLDANSYGMVNTWTTGAHLVGAAVSPDGRWLALSHEGEGDVWIHDLNDQDVHVIEAPHEMSWPVFSADSSQLFLGAKGDDALWVLTTGNFELSATKTVLHGPSVSGQAAYRDDPFLIFEDGFEGDL